MDFHARLSGSQGRADLQHVRAQDFLLARDEVVGVVLHERGAAGEPGAHDFGCPDQDGSLPVALGAEAVTVGHEALHGHARQLAQCAEVFEGRGEGGRAVGLQEAAEPKLDPGAVAQRLVAWAAGTELGGHLVELLVFGDEGVDVGLCRAVHGVGEFIDGPSVDRDAEAQLGLGLVPFGDGDIAHVVAETGQLEGPDGRPTRRGALPGSDLAGHLGVGHVADDGFARDAEAGLDVAELAVAVRGLVQVHEVEVDVRPRQFHVGLGVQVQERLPEQVQALDPHLGRGEGVHPRGHADHGVIRVGIQGGAADGVRVREHGLPDDFHRDVGGGVQRVSDVLGLGGDLLEDVLAVEVLAAGEEPDLELLKGRVVGVGHVFSCGWWGATTASRPGGLVLGLAARFWA
ncbi:hypothetical protein SRABI128_05928 [Microbacterium sp. Bi128]|nr:hypothetical protein SRABI128_05928 [Microbacterium sp. Bi128]